MNEKQYERVLLERRGWVSRWPEKLVFLYSGGMDSTITIARLLKQKEVEIFPVFIDRGQSNVYQERKSARYFSNYYKKKYNRLFHSLFEIRMSIPPGEIKDQLRKYSKIHGYPLRNTILQMVGVQYALSLLNKGIGVKSVFCAQVADDPFPHSTLSSLRMNTIDVCENLNEWDWQITSPNIDPFLSGLRIGKIEMIRWAEENGFPVEKTRSCYTSGEKACGKCLTCLRRKAAFGEAGVDDKTDYLV